MARNNQRDFEYRLRRELHAAAGEIHPVNALPDILARIRGSYTQIGATGTRNPLPLRQQTALTLLLEDICAASRIRRDKSISLHHGCCTGTDESTHHYVRAIPGAIIHGHPGIGNHGESPHRMSLVHMSSFDYLYEPKPYRFRNRDIVASVGLLIACPAYTENDSRSWRSGTWQTIRMARNARKPVFIVWPHGTAELDTGNAAIPANPDARETPETHSLPWGPN